MIYCTYEQYQAMGGSMAEEDFSLWGPRASRKIDQLTMGRAARYAQQQKDELAEACGQIADILRNAQAALVSSVALVSASNDGYSESYRSPEEMETACQNAVYRALSNALGNDPYNLLYRGICECW